MPGTLFPEMEHGSGTGLDDQRALQALALDLSMLGLTSEDDGSSTFDENRAKRSCNMTECVPVPSSEHVAEIVGRQGMYLFVMYTFYFNGDNSRKNDFPIFSESPCVVMAAVSLPLLF